MNSNKSKVELALCSIENTIYWLFAESNSLRAHGHAFSRTGNAREVRASAFRIGNDLDQLRQHLDELSHALSDYEVEEGFEPTSHGYEPKGAPF